MSPSSILEDDSSITVPTRPVKFGAILWVSHAEILAKNPLLSQGVL